MSFTRWTDIRGHGVQIEALLRVCRGQRPSHAYLFTGPASVGKGSVAWAMAAHLTCVAPDERTGACGQCRSCHAIQRGEHPEIHELKPQGSFIKIEQVRDVQKPLRYEATLGRARIVLIAQADRFGEEAANALLKILEEPPKRVFFLLVTSMRQKILSTIRSRSQEVRFGPLSEEDIAVVLAEQGFEDSDARQAASLAQGQLDRARTLCDPNWMEALDTIVSAVLSLGSGNPFAVVSAVDTVGAAVQGLSWSEQPVEETDVIIPTASLAEARALAKGKAPAAPRARKSAAKRRGWPPEALEWTLDVTRAALRDALLASVGIPSSQLSMARHQQALSALLERASSKQLAAALDVCLEVDRSLRLNPNPAALLETTWLQVHGRLTQVV